MVNDELVRPTDEDLGGQVPAQLAAEGTFDGDGTKVLRFPGVGNMPA
jgi:hypothetical protein